MALVMKINKIIEYIVVAIIVLGWTYFIVIKEILPKNIGYFISNFINNSLFCRQKVEWET